MVRRSTVLIVLAVFALVSVLGCSQFKKREKGAIIGAAAGGAVGAVIGNRAGSTATGAILGAVIGGAAGAYIGNRMDQAAAEMERDLEGARVERVGEGIKITWASGILFDVNKSDLRPVAQQNITDLARILQKYENTEVLVEGHTDTTGTEEWNMELSKRRAESVGNYLYTQGINADRLKLVGYGELQPTTTENTREGLQANRRVEIAIYANDELKDIARRQTEGG